MMLLTATIAQAQTSTTPASVKIKIGGNIYGGGNAGDTEGSTAVTIYAGNYEGKVFGGARQANVGGHAFVHIDGEHASNFILINQVYGGNDIAGTIGNSTEIPTELTEVIRDGMTDEQKKGKNNIDATWNAFVRISSKMDPDDPDNQSVYIGQLFGGGNGDYVYSSETNTVTNPETNAETEVITHIISDNDGNELARSKNDFTRPNLNRTYLEVVGGSIIWAFGGGNKATVTEKTVICVDNPSKVVGSIKEDGIELLTDDRVERMGVNLGYSNANSEAFQIGSFFGGNNKEPMAIRPTWNLKSGKIRNLYSGGNRGAMTSPVGLILDIKEDSKIIVDNVYGGCRMADVHPMLNSVDVEKDDIQLPASEGYHFPAGFSARLLVRGGTINNVYGGNDITGNVVGGNAVGIYTTIYGSVYGGGNGSYPYTDNPDLIGHQTYGDLYYSPKDILKLTGDTFTGLQSAEALKKFRPNAEQVSLRLAGKEKIVGDNTIITPAIIHGAVYVGGNSATLEISNTKASGATAHLKVGSHVIADSVFLGNNGVEMVKSKKSTDILQIMKSTTITSDESKFNSMDLEDAATFSEYMDGCAMTLMPEIKFDGDDKTDVDKYQDYTSYFGSFFCGGNVGSIIKGGLITIDFDRAAVIYDKVVGGCNNAYIAKTNFNAAYQGGVIGTATERAANGYKDNNGKIKDRLVLNLQGLKIEPKRWAVKRKGTEGDLYNQKDLDDKGRVQYLTNANGDHYLEWNTVDNREYNSETKTFKEVPPITSGSKDPTDADDEARRLFGGNIYGGCCTSGVVNGNVIINVDTTIVERQTVFDLVESDDDTGESKLYGNNYKITQRKTGVILDFQGMDVLGSSLNVFGGGKGKETEIWGSATVNLNRGYIFQVFGGSEEGAIGKRKTTTSINTQTNVTTVTDDKDENGRYVYEYNADYSTYVNLQGGENYPGVRRNHKDDSPNMAEAEFIYGGGFEGPIAGDTHINLGNGRVFNTFAGSCNADIQGHTETYIGRQLKNGVYVDGFPYVRDHLYGGNDLGGRILGSKNFRDRISSSTVLAKVHNPMQKMVLDNNSQPTTTPDPDVLNATAYIEYLQGRVEHIYGGCYGVYDYTDSQFKDYFYTTGSLGQTEDNLGKARPGYSKPFLDNAFVNFRPANSNSNNGVRQIYGAGQGNTEGEEMNKLQNRSYILIDMPEGMTTFNSLEVFGAGECGGVGMWVKKEADATPDGKSMAENLDNGSAIIDLLGGQINAAYGGSYQEGITRRTVVNVPAGSTIHANKLFGGAYGRIDVSKDAQENEVQTPRIDLACDVYEANVNYHSEDATIDVALYGGNNACRRTLYGKVNIDVPLKGGTHWTGLSKIYGAGFGADSWSQYTEVNLEKGAEVQEVYGGGENGQVINKESVAAWKTSLGQDTNGRDKLFTDLENGYTDEGLASSLASGNRLHEVDNTRPEKYNCNVHIKEGSTVARYSYGGGLGSDAIAHSGDVYGTTYIDLLGGTVKYDLYAAGTTGSVKDGWGVKNGFTVGNTDYDGFVASTTAYIEGGTARNVYGGGWKGSVGQHDGAITESYADDIPGETHVIIGILKDHLPSNPKTSTDAGYDPDYSFHHGIPVVERNAYGGGEGGAVFGDAHITLNNGYIGYRYKANGNEVDDPETTTIDERYVEKIDDETSSETGTLYNSGSIYGGGYIDNSSVDYSHVLMYGGHVRNALFGGGEIAAIGRGIINASGEDNSIRELRGIYKAGKTHVTLYDGYVHRNVFGGGRGYNYKGEGGNLYSDGYVFGQTEVNIYGGEVGTTREVAQKNGNVFGGGDIGYVYSAIEEDGKLFVGIKDGERYDNKYEGYYYKYDYSGKNNKYIPAEYVYNENDPNWVMDGTEYILTEDCKVLVEPHCKVTAAAGIDIDVHYRRTERVPENFLAKLRTDENYTVEKDENNKEIIKQGNKVIIKDGVVVADDGITESNVHFAKGEYVPTRALNTLANKKDDAEGDNKWSLLDTKGIIINNAVFAGGNTSVGSSAVYANAITIFGNVTASIHDVYHRDLITIGTGHVGGLYGEGNLTFVDGYRGLNITNYGTDYYTIEDTPQITITQYHALDPREAAYYELRYKCIQACTDKEGTHYTPGSGGTKASILSADDIMTLFSNNNGTEVTYVYDEATGEYLIVQNTKGEWVPNPHYWEENGVCTIYAGRPMNTIQRADFCGVFGSRMVMQGAQDRVPETVDYTNYTINRVREVSLNQEHSIIESDNAPAAQDAAPENEGYANLKKAIHGNYFGIYNVVNFLGALTSDQHFQDDIRLTDNTTNKGYKSSIKIGEDTYAYGAEGATYYNWKQAHKDDQQRNNGRSQNKVALASGVYLELTTEKSTGKDLYEKDWGYITGIVELDLINVQEGIGGGFVYAKNEHRACTYSRKSHSTLTSLNADAITQKDFDYTSPGVNEGDPRVDNAKVSWQTSGNFVHSTQTIIDDCYNKSGKYDGADAVPAHYWFIKGQVYIYDQYISAYTGAPSAYSESVEIPLTITAASHGTMKLLDVKPNKYAYYSTPGNPLEAGKKIVINEVTYYKNDPFSYWDWNLLGATEKTLFVDKTYVVTADCKLTKTDNSEVVEYKEGDVMLPEDYTAIKASAKTKVLEEGGEEVAYVYHEGKEKDVDFDFVFRPSNNLGHEAGYILTYKVNNPAEWDTWYTPKNGVYTGKIDTEEAKKQTELHGSSYITDNYEDGPTYRLKALPKGVTGRLLGQRDYYEGDLISEEEYYKFEGKTGDPNYPGVKNHVPEAQRNELATFDEAYIVTEPIESLHINEGFVLSKTEATTGDTYTGKAERAYLSTKTIQLSTTEFILLNARMTSGDKDNYLAVVKSRVQKILEISDERYNAISSLSDLTEQEKTKVNDGNRNKLTLLLTAKKEINKYILPAYFCTSKENEGHLYGGDWYEANKNYRGLAVLCSMAENERNQFDFNYDAFDLFIDDSFSNGEGQKWQYDAKYESEAAGNKAGYSVPQAVDYTATYNGTSSLSYTDENSQAQTISVGAEITRSAYEDIPNEQRYYVPIKADKDGYCYVVVDPSFQIGNTPYAVGKTTTKDIYESYPNQVVKVDIGKNDNNTYYFCREAYEIGHNGEGKSVKSVVDVKKISNNTTTPVTETIDVPKNQTMTSGTVPVGFVISKEGEETSEGSGIYQYGYETLTNKQENFTIHGISPTEISTLFVSRESDIFDLSAEKIITVVYQYTYEEGSNDEITPVSERHVVNIHIQFKSGIPTIDDIKNPPTIIPGDKLGLNEPDVSPGAYEVTGGGWKLFRTPTDAESHTNGIEYNPRSHPLYWYQDGYYLAYYAKTYLGETYSNNVQVSVANYHDLKDVMSDEAKLHHYYIDHQDVSRNPKIYINDYSNGETPQNGLDLLKSLFNLSLEEGTARDNNGRMTPIASGPFEGHVPLETKVKECKDLEIIMRTNIDYDGTSSQWEPIAGEKNGTGDYINCFEGNFHGDGHYVTGLDDSMFGQLCGNVYNLGVMGSFTGPGVANAGGGFVENCWVKSSKTSTTEPKGKAIFGHDDDADTHIVNCYYPKSNAGLYNATTGVYQMPDEAFYNGTVAYNLNGFYLAKRYYDNNTEWTGEKKPYKYIKAGLDGTLPVNAETQLPITESANYPAAFAYYPISTTEPAQYGYVEDRFADGDFRYAGGTIPETTEEREYVDGADKKYAPIWPDDYLFFGQMLTFGWNSARPHEDVPSTIYKSGGRLAQTDLSNRVYRAPAYFQTKNMDVVHFNPAVNLVAYAKPADPLDTNLYPVYPNMTAIDFKGHNDTEYTMAAANARGFYLPLLDDGGLFSIVNRDETRNLLVYAPEPMSSSATAPTKASEKTYSVLAGYFKNVAYSDYYIDDKYRRVTAASTSNIFGHIVQSDLTANCDHLLVDKQSFDCPISYTFTGDKRMWYQRVPERYVDISKGWETVSLPFTAELVTTDDKGEITHFYSGSTTISGKNINGDVRETKIGHEYWLREYKGGAIDANDATVFKTTFNYPDASGATKTATNTFLWDHYYSANTQKDANTDTYQTYYNSSRTLTSYPLLANGTPYIIGFPGKRYYEFDLSGEWTPANTATPAPDAIGKQTITFASAANMTVSNAEVNGVAASGSGYTFTFMPNYLDKALKGYHMNTDGDRFEKGMDTSTETPTEVAVKTVPFRPYFILTSSPSLAPRRAEAKYIIFDSSDSSFAIGDDDPSDELAGELTFSTKPRKLVVTSSMRQPADVHIYSVSGQSIATFSIQNGETIETDIPIAGVYIVRAANGRYTKKFAVK